MNQELVLKQSKDLPDGVTEVVKGYDFNKGIDYGAVLDSYSSMGIQGTNLKIVFDIINEMLDMKSEPLSKDEVSSNLNPIKRPLTNCTIFLGYTANMISCGVREQIRYIVEHNMVDVIVASAGGIEEDFIKCFASTYIGNFKGYDGVKLHEHAINRIGNMLVPNSNYVKFDAWLKPILLQMHKEQDANNFNWTPSKFIHRLGKEINNPESVYYWCYKNNIPVFCPGLTDGSIGDLLYFHSMTHPGFRIDVVEDVCLMDKQATCAKNSGILIIGGGIIKHHIMNANLMRGGANFGVYINTGNEFEASDSGAPPDEAVSWGKFKSDAKIVKLISEASLVFPLIVGETFAKRVEKKKYSDL